MIIIRKDTVWGPGTKVLSDDVQIAEGATLTIAPGAQIVGNGHWIQAYGTLSAKGTASNPIFFDKTLIKLSDNVDSSAKVILDYAHVNNGTISELSGDIYGVAQITNSTVTGLIAPIFVGSTERAGQSTYAKNTFLDSFGIYTTSVVGSTISGNIFDRYDHLTGPFGVAATGIPIITTSAVFASKSYDNAFLVPGATAISLTYDSIIDSRNDWFGTTDKNLIADMIHDRHDDRHTTNAVDLSHIAQSPSSELPRSMFSFTSVKLPRDIIVEARLLGSADIDLTGNTLDNTLTGNGGDNVIDGGLGADTMIGGAGNDTYVVDNARDVILENAGKGYDRVVASVSYTLANNVEKLTLAGAKAINATGNGLANHLVGNGAANALDGKGGVDVMEGGAGNDVYFVDHASDRVIEAVGEGRDTVVTTVSYKLAADQQIEILQTADADGKTALKLTGNTFSNKLVGNAGNNVLDGQAGIDEMRGGAGDDTYAVDHARDIVVEAIGGGTDTVMASVSYTLAAGQEIESLRLHRSTGSTTLDLTGNEFAQALIGNDGANVLDSRLGNDTMVGRGGADTFVFSTAIGTGNVDHITDFAAVDTIRLSKSVFTALAPGQLSATAFKDIGTGKVDADDRILYDSRYGLLSYDADGLGKAAAVQFAVLDNKTAITHADFLIA